MSESGTRATVHFVDEKKYGLVFKVNDPAFSHHNPTYYPKMLNRGTQLLHSYLPQQES